MIRIRKEGVEYDGHWFNKDQKTGYYLNSTIHKRLHRYVWEHERGVIPRGYDIHHIDHNKDNNDISNLELLSRKDHQLRHGIEMSEDHRKWLRDNMNKNARPAAIIWHKSKEGREWHRKHAIEVAKINHRTYQKECLACGNKFLGLKNDKFCSNACKSRWRRMNHTDDIECVCAICGKKFNRNLYSARRLNYVVACSRTCGFKLAARNRKKQA